MGKPILNELFENKNKHIEDVPEIDKNEFIKTVKVDGVSEPLRTNLF